MSIEPPLISHTGPLCAPSQICHQVKPKPKTPPNRTQLQLSSFSPQPLARYSLCIPSPFSAFLRHPWAPRYTRTRWNPDVSGILEGPGTPEQAQTVPRTSYCASPSLGPCPKSSHSPTPNQHQHGVKHTENSSFLPSKEAWPFGKVDVGLHQSTGGQVCDSSDVKIVTCTGHKAPVNRGNTIPSVTATVMLCCRSAG